MEAWWQGLGTINKAFAVSAVIFSLAFLWQMIVMLLGIDRDGHGHAGDAGIQDGGHLHGDASAHGGESVAFTFVSVRSVMAFGMLFSWAGTLYLAGGTSPIFAIAFSFLWGLAAMFAVSYVLYWLLRMQERGNVSISTAIGEDGTVYMDIPPGGTGKVRVRVGGCVSFVNARSRDGEALPAGTKVKVVGVIDERTVEVKAEQDFKGD